MLRNGESTEHNILFIWKSAEFFVPLYHRNKDNNNLKIQGYGKDKHLQSGNRR